jgi:ABC-type branched-subunit amino acid transport system ATPase component
VSAPHPPLLQASGISFSYGALQVLFDVSIEVPEGGRVCLLGTNGAGKSTLLQVVAGLNVPSAGSVVFAGEDVTGLRPEERFARGLALVEGGRAICSSLTVLENLRLGAFPFLSDRTRVQEGIERALDTFPQLASRLGQAAGTLSGGEQQMLALARSLMSSPRLLMIDELGLGLAPVVMESVVSAVEDMTRSGITLLLVEQSLNVAVALADQGFFMEKGEIRFSGRTEDLMSRGDLVRSVFFGTAPAR